ncbi:hypothetical protein FQN57_001596 [Myotisia sp. PD_48]|nr:hypothetical protein FQN57_001596 [Myotisia sp. PD_48]
MAYIAPIHSASSIRSAVKAQFMKLGEDCLIVGKSNRIEIYALSQDGLILQHSKAIYGKITVLQRLPRNSPPGQTDLLFVGTDRCAYFTLSWDPRAKQLHTERKFIDLNDSSLRLAPNGDRCLIDSSGRFIALEVYEGVVTIIPLTLEPTKKTKAPVIDKLTGELGEPLLARIEELQVRSSTFLHRGHDQIPRMAFLYEDTRGKVKLKLRDLIYTHVTISGDGSYAADLQSVTILSDELEAGASILIPVPQPLGGFLILGESSIKYVDDFRNETISRPLEESTVFVAWEQVDGQRWLLADDYGRLFFLMLLLDSDNAVESWKLDFLGETSHASVLIYLAGGVVFIGSHLGDSQVIRITEGSFEVIQTIANIAPIVDFTVMDLGNRSDIYSHEFSSGQARIVTGSGAFKDGSLRSVRSGVGMEEIGVLADIEHITDLFSCRYACDAPYSDLLLVSFIDESRIFRFCSNGEVEEKDEFLGFNLSESTLLACNIPGSRLLQVTEKSARIADLDSGMVTWEWKSTTRHIITAASANDDFLVLVIGGQKLMCFSLSGREVALSGNKTFEADNQISGLEITASPVNACILCLPQSSEIVILELPSFIFKTKRSLGSPSDTVPRSVIVAEILENRPPTLFVSIADGTIISFSFNTMDFSLSDPSKIVLGSEQPLFKKLPCGDGRFNVFATCDHPTLIYASEGRLIYSAVNADRTSRICSLNTETYPGSVAVATPNELKIALVDQERTTQLHTLPLQATVRKITYSKTEKAFVLGTIKRTIDNGVETVQSQLVLADEIILHSLSTFDLNQEELVESVIRAPFADGEDKIGNIQYKDLFFISTSYLDAEEDDELRGRILIFEVNKSRELAKLAEIPVNGACRVLAIMDENKLVAGLTKQIVVYRINRAPFGAISLEKSASYISSTTPIDLTVTGNIIAVADLMKSLAIVEYKQSEDGKPDTMTEIARHFETLWSTAVAEIAENSYLESDAAGNLIVLTRNTMGVTEEDRRRMQVTSEMCLGELVNRIFPINVRSSAKAAVSPRLLLATAEGSIYIFGVINSGFQDLLIRLQVAMADFITSPGELPFNSYRAFKTNVREAGEPFRFVDGELIERFLSLPPETQKQVVRRLADKTLTVDKLKSIIEELKRIN